MAVSISTSQAEGLAAALITPQPGHFLHVSLAGVAGTRRPPSVDEIKAALEPAEQAWRGTVPFEVC
jgi:hypothetical protein